MIESPINRFQTPSNRFTGVRTATRKYVKYDSGFEELFDLQADPHELKNEAGQGRLRGRPRIAPKPQRRAQGLHRPRAASCLEPLAAATRRLVLAGSRNTYPLMTEHLTKERVLEALKRVKGPDLATTSSRSASSPRS